MALRSSTSRMETVMRPLYQTFGFAYHPRMFGNPDFAHTGLKIAVFLDGCFFHGCPLHYREPVNNSRFWRRKIAKSRSRDAEVTTRLEKGGWRVIRHWEHDVLLRGARRAE